MSGSLLLTAEPDEPFAQVDAIIQTHEDAARWVQFFDQMRTLALWPASDFVPGWDKHIKDPDCLDWVHFVHEAAQDPERLAYCVCRIDLWTVRTRLEWGLAWEP